MLAEPDIQPTRSLGLCMNPRLWTTLPNTDTERPNCRYPVLGAEVMTLDTNQSQPA
jgi:hypothetical protein